MSNTRVVTPWATRCSICSSGKTSNHHPSHYPRCTMGSAMTFWARCWVGGVMCLHVASTSSCAEGGSRGRCERRDACRALFHFSPVGLASACVCACDALTHRVANIPPRTEKDTPAPCGCNCKYSQSICGACGLLPCLNILGDRTELTNICGPYIRARRRWENVERTDLPRWGTGSFAARAAMCTRTGEFSRNLPSAVTLIPL